MKALRTPVDRLTSNFREKLNKVRKIIAHELGTDYEVLPIMGRYQLGAE